MGKLLAYLDESGDHSMKNVDPSSPIFCLTLALFEEEPYVELIVPAVTRLKMKYFGHDAVVLHSYDIRKEIGPFSILRDATVRNSFMADLDALMSLPHYELISIAIDKVKHANQYATPHDPYELSLEFALERLVEWAEIKGGIDLAVIAESRGKKEDNALAAEFLRVTNSGTAFVPRTRFDALQMRFSSATKAMNLPGHQIADLAAHVVAQQVRRPSTQFRPWHIIHPRFFRGRKGWVYGLKIFPR